MKRVERDPEGSWIARRRDGAIIPDEDFRWNSRLRPRRKSSLNPTTFATF
jgi:hypothetical protein